ncbi:MAG: tRNA uridine-5-carboxymethylaminomethyl(34) synthesis GTPase MnmE, partial [Candidatus Eremiobacteraeota bacterium]|nr:tRNA uridine-5-carboxymethylaminomethyl(34) synthesis GTPase MnmE [Candidatus Eremiobacteraeota bacterium]
GAIAIVRCSGPEAREIAARVFRSAQPLRDRVATYGEVLDVHGAIVDRALAIAMDAPRTVTGEDVVELHVHGSPVVARETLRALLHAGARAAGPGEFTRRAFLNGKLDLSAAEAVADVIDAETRAAARAAQANLAGGLRAEVDKARAALATVLEELAGAIDYPDEVPEPPRACVAATVAAVDDGLAALMCDWERGRLVREGLSLAIVGPPNAGKSSLLNALLGEERAIVSEIAGTTRDVIEDRFAVDGVLVRVLDTAGLRATDDAIERIGVDRAQRALDAAAVALVVVDGARPLDPDARAVLARTRNRPRVVLFNKRDLGTTGYAARDPEEHDALSGSVLRQAQDDGVPAQDGETEETLAAVRHAIALAGWHGDTPDITRPHLASARQADAVARAREALAHGAATLAAGEPLDLVVPDLLVAVASLGEVTGAAATEAILDGVFARFCIGK